MCGACVFQLEMVSLANVAGGTQANGCHPGRYRRPNAAGAIFHNETLLRLHAQPVRREQKMSG